MGIVGNAFLLTTKEQSQKGIGAEQCNKYNTVLYCETLSLLSLSAKLASKMDSSPQQQAQWTLQYASRTNILCAIQNIVRQILLLRLDQPQAHSATPARLIKAQRCRALEKSHILEEFLYRRASSIVEYQDLSMLEEWVFRTSRVVYINAQRREMERESHRRGMNGDTDQSVEESGQGRRRVLSS